MRPIAICCTVLFTMTMTFAASALHAGSAPPGMSSADAAAFRDFTLTDELLDKYLAVEKDIAKDPCRLGLSDMMKGKYENMSLDEAAAHWDAKPGVHEMLASHDITAKQMILGFGTLLQAAFQDLAEKYPKMASQSSGPGVSDANMAFYHAHKEEIRQHSRMMGQRRLQANGGKASVPSCMKNLDLSPES